MLELFSRKPEMLLLAEGSVLTPIPMNEEVSSLSAILLDEGYYQFIRSGIRQNNGLPFAEPEHLIPLKARAWMDLTKRKKQGDSADRRDIKKHRNDVFRLYGIIDPGFGGEIPENVRQDMDAFIRRMEEENVNLEVLGLGNAKQGEILADLRRIYCRG
jgi:hypothetical protein